MMPPWWILWFLGGNIAGLIYFCVAQKQREKQEIDFQRRLYDAAKRKLISKEVGHSIMFHSTGVSDNFRERVFTPFNTNKGEEPKITPAQELDVVRTVFFDADAQTERNRERAALAIGRAIINGGYARERKIEFGNQTEISVVVAKQQQSRATAYNPLAVATAEQEEQRYDT